MNIDDGNTEITFTLVGMGFLLIICIIAVVAFFRVWRKERKQGGRGFFE
jgi:preprotein translocase subunit YajC